MKFLNFLLFLCLLGTFKNAQAYITYSNGRIDRALYDGHDPKTIVAGKISLIQRREEALNGSLIFSEGPSVLAIDLSIASVIMGDGNIIGQKLNLITSSFTWPEELVKLDTGVFCILILRDWNSKPDSVDWHIEVVIPSENRESLISSPPYLRIKNNAAARDFLEEELLLVLKSKIHRFKIRETLLLLGPILKPAHVKQIVKFVEYKNDWVIRTALACIVYSTHDSLYTKMLAKNINKYFSCYKEDDMLKAGDDFMNYAAYNVYYTYVFFLDPNDRTWGTRWHEEEENLNKQAILKLKATELLSKQVCKKLKIDF